MVDVDRLFTNMETVCEVSAALLHRLHEAMADPDPEAVVIGNNVVWLPNFITCSCFNTLDERSHVLFCFFEGEVFIQAKAALEDVYKIYCYHHDDANMLLKSYEEEEDIKQQFATCVLALK